MNIKDDLSKYCQIYLNQDKTTEIYLSKFKDFIKRNIKPQIIRTGDLKEFKSNVFEEFCLRNDIGLMFGSPFDQWGQRAMEAFYEIIIENLRLCPNCPPS